ncbi:hypothetical protein BLNAU_12965 [Blattamonas nauphoetae]|uniref:Uncharacterized protein n=1 Tax=Blattamonas nauphoetae TaxID=2049346 RepID=A0ABQ9XK54_9EUKA|nr:hypothetical protein BLNAU_12965 [Blattamonas nauphoetae]
MSVTDPDTGKVYKQIDDGSGSPRWIEENNMCSNKYVDGLGYVNVPSMDWKPGCGPTVLKEPPKSVQSQLDQMNKMGMMPEFARPESAPAQAAPCAESAPPPAPAPRAEPCLLRGRLHHVDVPE